MAAPIRIPDDLIIEKLKEHNLDIEYLGRILINKESRGNFKCNKCGYIFNRTVHMKMFNTMRCMNCQNFHLERRITKYSFINRLSQKNIELISDFNGLQNRVDCKCKVCGHEWDVKGASVYGNTGCPSCGIKSSAKAKIKSDKQFKKEMKECCPDLDVIGTYLNEETELEFYCKKHNWYFKKKAKYALGTMACDKCLADYRANLYRKKDYVYDEELSNFNENVIRIGEYVNTHTKTEFKCLVCDSVFLRTPHDALKFSTCPVCTNKSTGEMGIENFLKVNKIRYIFQKSFENCKDKNPLPFDFYFKDFNILCEFQGEYHYFPVDFRGEGKKWAEKKFKYTKKHDKIKKEYCENNNIELLEIPYWERENINNFLYNFFKEHGIITKIPNK